MFTNKLESEPIVFKLPTYLKVGENVGPGNKATINCPPALSAGDINLLENNPSTTCRSEERRVGKECPV